MILILIFAAIIGAVVFVNRDREEKVRVIMGEPVLPVVSMLGSSGGDMDIEINELFGYKMQMDTRYMRDSITPIGENRQLTSHVRNCDNYIMSAGFELRTLDCERLIERTDVADSDIIRGDEFTDIHITLDNMIEAGEEYFFVLWVNTDRVENVYYYTRVVQQSDNHCREQLEFVKNFSDATYTKEADKIISYIEPDPSEDNTNYGHVTIKSNYKQITWGELSPEKVTTPIVSIKEILGDVGCYQLIYKIKALNDYDTYQYYKVTEYFRVKWTGTEIYLLDYDRTMEQIFDANNQNISTMRINLGISKDEDCEFMSSDNNSYIAFAKNGGLWLMDIRHNQAASIFAFQMPEDEEVRNTNTDSYVKIISVDDSGDTEFIVYGYMSRGEHEGMVGISLYNYDTKANVVKEKIFIPFARQAGILREMMGRMFYVNENDVMYITLSDSVYSVDITGSEYVQIISGLEDNSFATNKSGNIIAWEEKGEGGRVDIISILNLDTGEEKQIQAEEGKSLKVSGFIDDDFVYGVAETGDISVDATGKATVAMKKLVIVDMQGKVLKEYSKEGYYFTDTHISANMISVTRVTRNAEGSGFVKADDYQIFGNEEQELNVVTADVIKTERKKKEVVIEFVKKVTTSANFKNIYPKEIVFSDTNALDIYQLISDDEQYYIYGRGQVKGIVGNLSDAIRQAYDLAGVVIDSRGQYAWARISRPVSYELAVPNLSVQDIESHISKNLKGTSLEQMLYYICNGVYVAGRTNEAGYVIIVGYDFYNAVLVNPASGEKYKQGQEETAAMFEAAGNDFALLK